MKKLLSILFAVLFAGTALAQQNPGLLLQGAFTPGNGVKIVDRFHVQDLGAPALTNLTAGSTPIISCTAGYILYNNGGVLGCAFAFTSLGLTTPVITGTPTGTGVATLPTASTLALRDAAANVFANSFVSNVTNTASAGGTTVLTVASPRYQRLTGTLNQTYQLPNATTLSNKVIYEFDNNSSGTLTIVDAGSNTVATMLPGMHSVVSILDNSTANGVWDQHYLLSTWPNTTTTYVRGDGTFQTLNFAALGGSASAAQIAGSAASHAVPVDVAGTPTWKVLPDCQDTAGNHLNYTQSTDAFSCGTTGTGGRIKQVANTSYYVTTGGNDNNVCSIGSPCATPIGAYRYIQKNIDAGGFTITINIADGTYTASNQLVGPVVGQAGEVAFVGNVGTPANVLIKPATGGSPNNAYAFSGQAGAHFTLSGMKLDQTNNTDPAIGSDTLAMDYFSKIGINAGVIFGNNLAQWNDASINGTLEINASYSIIKDTVSTTGTWTNGSNTITVASATGILKYMGVSGTNIPNGAYVANIVGTTVTLGYVAQAPVTATTGAGSGTALLFSYGGQCHFDAGTIGRLIYQTNGDPAFTITMTVSGTPMYTSGTFFINQLSVGYMSAITLSPASPTVINAVPFTVQNNSIIDTNLQGSYYLAGGVGSAGATGGTTTSGNTTVVVTDSSKIKTGNVITPYEALTSTFASGSTAVTSTGAANVTTGWKVSGPGIAAGTIVVTRVGTAVTISSPTTAAGSGVVLVYTDGGLIIPTGSYVTSITDATHIVLSKAPIQSLAGLNIWPAGLVQSGGQYQFLLKRDLDPAANDNTPAFLNQAA